MHKPPRDEQPKRQAKDGETRAIAATIRWAQVLPVDFEGEDTSLTQAQLAVLK
jgi:hypothetical protein